MIALGFRNRFCNASSSPPYLSRGTSLSTSRFYFADAAAKAYLHELYGDEEVERYLIQRPELLPNIGQSLHALVTTFVNLRGYAWRKAAG